MNINELSHLVYKNNTTHISFQKNAHKVINAPKSADIKASDFSDILTNTILSKENGSKIYEGIDNLTNEEIVNMTNEEIDSLINEKMNNNIDENTNNVNKMLTDDNSNDVMDILTDAEKAKEYLSHTSGRKLITEMINKEISEIITQ